MKFLKKYKYIIIVYLIISVSYLLIHTVPELFGIDDTLANSYIFHPEYSFIDKINHIIDRLDWNVRIGEIFYFIVGCFPRYVYYFFNTIRLLVLLNLVYVYTFGKKSIEYLHSYKYPLCLVSCYLLILTVFPAFSQTLIWMAGTYNHIFDFELIMIISLYFRLLIDGIDILSNHKKIVIPFLIISFVSAFTLEHVVPCMLIYNSTILIYVFIKNKYNINEFISKYKYAIMSIIFISIGLIIFFFTTKARIDFFNVNDMVVGTKYEYVKWLLSYYQYALIYIGLIILLFIITNIHSIKEKLGNISHILFLICLSCLSLLIIYISPAYYSIRETLFLFFSLLCLSSYLLGNIITNKKIFIILMIVCIATIGFMTYRLRVFYKDFNYYNKLRTEYIIWQHNEGINQIACPLYDNKLNYFFPYRLTSIEDMYCDQTYIRYFVNDDSVVSYATYEVNLR